MGLIDKLRRVGGIAKNRLASAVGALRTQAAGLRVRVPRVLGLTARAARLTTPLGIGITAVSFAPQIARGARVAAGAISRGIAFVGGRQVVTAAGAGGVVGVLTSSASRKEGKPTRPSEVIQSTARRPSAVARGGAPTPRRRTTARRPSAVARGGAPRRRKRKTTRRRIPAHGHRVVSTGTRSTRRKRRTHSSPRHRGHKRVSFTTADGRKVSFLANPTARHR